MLLEDELFEVILHRLFPPEEEEEEKLALTKHIDKCSVKRLLSSYRHSIVSGDEPIAY